MGSEIDESHGASGRPRTGEIAPGPAAPTAPIAIAGGAATARSRRRGSHVGITDAVLKDLRGVCASVSDDPSVTGEASRDWWPLAMTWAVNGEVPARAAAVVRPETPDEVAAVLAVCNRWGLPVTAAGGRSGVCGASVPLFGGVVLDMCGLSGIRSVDDASLVVDVLPGTFGDRFEEELRSEHGLTCGHWPQSMTLSTVGGWIACRGAGQLSTRYGKIEDMVVGLDVALADGRTIRTGGFPRVATGPDLNQLFVGSEGTLGVITGARLAVHPAPAHERRGAWSVSSFEEGLEFCRRVLRRGATPAVLRLYDEIESARNYDTGPGQNVVLVLDEGDPVIVDATMAVVSEVAAGVDDGGAEALDESLVEHWVGKRNDVSALERLISGGLVVDTMEISGTWSTLPGIYRAALDAIGSVDGTLAVSAHCSHSYLDGACLYFTFAGQPEKYLDGGSSPTEGYYRAVWDAGTRAVLAHGGSLSHHHGVGINRSRYVKEALDEGLDVLIGLKKSLDPGGILNPGKLGLPSRFGAIGLP
jgi:alkyldihydroxyacetonephosphate synthase